MVGTEVNFVVPDSLQALELYERIFEVKRLEVTNFSRGHNEAVFTIYGSRFHMLDENPEYQLMAPVPGTPLPIWINVLVPDIQKTFDASLDAGCKPIQPPTPMEQFGITNAIVADPFGYTWMLHQVHREVSFEERMQIFKDMGFETAD